MKPEISPPIVAAVPNAALLFRYSGLVDALRDAVGQLLDHSPHPETVRDALMQHNKLREHMLGVVDEDGFTEICTWTSHLDGDAPLTSVYLSCVTLARVVDVVNQTPEFLLAQQVREMNAGEVRSQIENARPRQYSNPSVLHFGMTNGH
jgi:hypothetical protein